MAPRQLAEVYSEAELRTMLAMTPDAECLAQTCARRSIFVARYIGWGIGSMPPPARSRPSWRRGARVQLPGARQGRDRHAFQRFRQYRRLQRRASARCRRTGAGVPDRREMGHVLSRHQEENSAINISVSVAAALVMPMAAVLRGAAATISLLGKPRRSLRWRPPRRRLPERARSRQSRPEQLREG